MQELQPDKPVAPVSKRGRQIESASLGGALRLINTPEFSDTEGDGHFAPPDPIPGTASAPAPQRAKAGPPPVPTSAVPVPTELNFPDKIYTTGRLMAGKDHVLTTLGYQIFGLADPLYRLQEHFFPGTDKATPGARAFLQTIGQWGRGQVDLKYPLSTERAAFVAMIRAFGARGELGTLVNWEDYGRDENIWLDCLLRRTRSTDFPLQAVSNVRFENEASFLTADGWQSFHVFCSPQTWEKRLKAKGLTPKSPEVSDFSEQYAIAMDNAVRKAFTSQPRGPKLRAIWNDEAVKCPSDRLIDFKTARINVRGPA
jgi:hypothetical protein